MTDPSNLYATLLEEHGPTPQGAGWQNVKGQWTRFERLFHLIGSVANYTSIMDVGCSYGELLEFLASRRSNLNHRLRYSGVDLTHEAIWAAKKRYKDDLPASITNAPAFIIGDIRDLTPTFQHDVVVASGLLAYWEFPDQLQIIQAMRAHARHIVAFNGRISRHNLALLLDALDPEEWSAQEDKTNTHKGKELTVVLRWA